MAYTRKTTKATATAPATEATEKERIELEEGDNFPVGACFETSKEGFYVGPLEDELTELLREALNFPENCVLRLKCGDKTAKKDGKAYRSVYFTVERKLRR